MDLPNERSSHSQAIPRGGGLACLAGVLAGLLVAGPDASWVVFGTLAAIAVLTAVGHLDDRRSLPPATRLLAQVAAGVLAGAPHGPVWALLGAAGFLVVVNCVNFMDGINGITSATILTWGGPRSTWPGPPTSPSSARWASSRLRSHWRSFPGTPLPHASSWETSAAICMGASSAPAPSWP